MSNRLKTIAMVVARRAARRAPADEPWEDVIISRLDIGEVLDAIGPDDCEIESPDAEHFLVSLPKSAATRLRQAEELKIK